MINLLKIAQAAILYAKYRSSTMVYPIEAIDNLMLARDTVNANSVLARGNVVECGTWRGGMAAALMEFCGEGRQYHFFDSFQGLPDPTTDDGPLAVKWKADRTNPRYFNNCLSTRKQFEATLNRARGNFEVYTHEGWLSNTTTTAEIGNIAVLRLDVDWYDATGLCLEKFWPSLLPGGIVLLDDYYCWPGCRKAVHAFLGSRPDNSGIQQSRIGRVAHLYKSNGG